MHAYLAYESFLNVFFTLSSVDSAKGLRKVPQGLAFMNNFVS